MTMFDEFIILHIGILVIKIICNELSLHASLLKEKNPSPRLTSEKKIAEYVEINLFSKCHA